MTAHDGTPSRKRQIRGDPETQSLRSQTEIAGLPNEGQSDVLQPPLLCLRIVKPADLLVRPNRGLGGRIRHRSEARRTGPNRSGAPICGIAAMKRVFDVSASLAFARVGASRAAARRSSLYLSTARARFSTGRSASAWPASGSTSVSCELCASTRKLLACRNGPR